MRMTKEELSVRVVVRRRSTGATPFAWEVHQTEFGLPLHVSAERFASMEAAYQAGQARLKEFIPTKGQIAADLDELDFLDGDETDRIAA